MLIIVKDFMHLSDIKIKKDSKAVLSIILQLSLLILSLSYSLLYAPKANAYTTAFVRFDRQYANANLSGVVCLKPSNASQNDTKVIVGFPSTFTLDATNTHWSVDTTTANLPNTSTGDSFTATAWPGISGPTVVDNATKAAIFSSTQLTSTSSTYCFHFNGDVGATTSNVGAAGNNETAIFSTWQAGAAGGAQIESVQYATSIVSGTNGEQIQVNATVSASFTFAFSGSGAGSAASSAASLPFGVLNTTNVTTAPYSVTAQISTNGRNGFLSWVKGTSNVGLYSNTTNQAIPSVPWNSGSPTTLVAGTSGYGIYALTGTNSPTIASEYNTTDNGTAVGQVSNASFLQIASLTGYQSSTTFSIKARAAVGTEIKPATDYTDVLTVVASGSF